MTRTASACLALALSILAPAAMAADLPARMPVKAPEQLPVEYGYWAGFYVGLNGGGGWSDFNPGGSIAPFTDPSGSGWTFGGHAGYNWQPYQSIVVGLEMDYRGANINDSQRFNLGAPGFDLGLDTEFDRLGSVRGRVGWVAIPQVMLYGTAGLAYGHHTAMISVITPGATVSTSSATNDFGWVAGVGAEWAVIPQVIVGLQYLHWDFANAQNAFQPIGNVNSSATVDTVEGRISYKFGGR